MITSRKVSQYFGMFLFGSPSGSSQRKEFIETTGWFIEASMKDNRLNSILISVAYKYYTAAMRVINKRKVA